MAIPGRSGVADRVGCETVMFGALLAIIGIVGAAYILLQAGDGVDTSAPANVQRIAQAIASAEGFFRAGTRPQRNHNPGDMTADLVGRGVGFDGPFVIYANDEDGWANLYAQVNAWLNGHSAHADAESTIFDLSRFYTANDQDAWAANVANAAGVSIDTPIGGIA
jgi:hypothetical protein